VLEFADERHAEGQKKYSITPSLHTISLQLHAAGLRRYGSLFT